jgi:hypothetical protein
MKFACEAFSGLRPVRVLGAPHLRFTGKLGVIV